MTRCLAVFFTAIALLSASTTSGTATAQAQETVPVDERILEALIAGESVEVVVIAEQGDTPPPPSRRGAFNAARRAEVQAVVPNAEVVIELQSIPAVTLRVDSVADLVALQSDPAISSVTLGGQRAVRHLDESREIVRADLAYARGVRGAGRTVVVIDSGYDRDHPDLADSLSLEVCYIRTDDCPNGQSEQFGPGAARDDSIAHGTRVSGIITSDGEVAPLGIAPDADVVAVKIFDEFDGGWLSDLTRALDYMLVNRPDVDVINMSLGYTDQFTGSCDADFPDLAALVELLRANGTVVVASSGNDSSATMSAPACITGVVSVAASVGITGASDFGEIADFSNVSTVTDVAAPGAQVRTTNDGGGSVLVAGTSFSAPTVAACAVLLMEQGFDSSAAQVEGRLRTSPVRSSRPGATLPLVDCGPSTIAMGGGDVDCSGSFNINDARSLSLFAVGLAVDGGSCANVGPGEIRAADGDLDRNGSVNIADARIASLCAVGLDNPNC